MPGTATVGQVAKALNVTIRRVNQLANEGMPREEHGKYNLAECMLWYIRYLQRALERREGSPEDTVGATIRSERGRLLKAQADREELELSRERNELISIDQYERLVSAQILTARQLLLTLPGSVAPELEGEPAKKIRVILEKAMRRALQEVGSGGNGHSGIITGHTGANRTSAELPARPVESTDDT